jgi:hypothetical protein
VFCFHCSLIDIGCSRPPENKSHGLLLPNSVSRVLTSALQHQHQEVADLQQLLQATTQAVQQQSAQIALLQRKLLNGQQQSLPSDDCQTQEQHWASLPPAATATCEAVSAPITSASAAFAQGLALAYNLDYGRQTDVAGSSSRSRQPTNSQQAGATDIATKSSRTTSLSMSCRPNSACHTSLERSPGLEQLSSSDNRQRSASAGRIRPSTASASARPHSRAATPNSVAGGQHKYQRQQQDPHEGCSSKLNPSPRPAYEQLFASSPSANFPRRRPTTAGGVGMMACLRSDIEAWRARG